MKLLLVSAFVPHRSIGHGTATVMSRFVEHFARSHELWVATFYHDPSELAQVRELESICAGVRAVPFPRWIHRQWTRLRGVFDRRPFMVRLFDVPAMRRCLREILHTESFDCVRFDTTQMGQYVDSVDDVNAKTVLVEIDVSMKPARRVLELETSWWKRLLYRRDWRRMCAYEPELCAKFDLVYAVSDEDRALLQSARETLPLSVMRFGVDSTLCEIPPKVGDENVVVFLGSFMHPPNVDGALWFYRSIVPRVRASVGGLEIVFVGGTPPADIAALADDPGVEVTGWVDDVGAYLRRADVCVVPLRTGGGVKLKTLEMMAAGRAVVTTRVGCEGIGVEDGRHVAVADSEIEFADAVVRLLGDGSARAAMGSEARALIVRDHLWPEVLDRLERQLTNLVRSSPGSAASVEPHAFEGAAR